ncbi:hypothetical protein [Thermococcus sp.]
MVSENPIFWMLFIFQLIVWIVLNFTKIGRIISVGWGSTTLLGFVYLYTLGPYGFQHAWDVGYSGNTTLIANFIVRYFETLTNYIIQLVIPPWVGLFVGVTLSHTMENTGGGLEI